MRASRPRATVGREMGRRAVRSGAALCVAIAGMLAAPAVSGAGFTVEEISLIDPPGTPAFTFSPDRVDAPVFQRVRWSRSIDSQRRHSVTQDDKLFRLPPTREPIDFTRKFSAGVFRYYCEIHGSPDGGMNGVVRITPGVDTDPLGPNFDVDWADDETLDTGDIFDVRYRRQGASKWKRWLLNTSLVSAEFGLDNEPERAVAGRAYEFSVRSKDGDNPKKRSGWSPVLVVVP
jgi:plastocyanin